jgi:hypothetical protein
MIYWVCLYVSNLKFPLEPRDRCGWVMEGVTSDLLAVTVPCLSIATSMWRKES